MIMKPFVSVIVPVYKVEKYLPRCLDSLCRQSLQNIEILLIDDASPDHCGTICEAYAVKDKRFKVFHHSENKGLSAARNLGIRQATADYLMFVDSDDWVHEDFCKAPYKCAVRNKADLVMFNYQLVQGSTFGKLGHQNIKTSYLNRDEAIELLFKNFAAWNKLYRKEIFNGVCFPEGRLFEDVTTTYKLFWNASSIYFLDLILYYYLKRSGSITTTKMDIASLKEWFEMHLDLYEGLLDKGYSKEKTDLYFQRIALKYCIKKKKDYTDPYYAISASVIRKINTLRKDFTWKQNILIKMFQFCPTLFNLTCMLFNKHVD